MTRSKVAQNTSIQEPTEDEKIHDGQNISSSPPQPATFKGRLQMSDFMFKSTEPTVKGETSPIRRSPRFKSSTSSASVATTQVTITKKTKRRDTEDKENDVTPKKKRARPSSGYAPPSTYAHLSGLPDAITDNLLVLFIGLNPGIQTARTGHAYAHPSNLFWKLLYSSGLTPRLCSPTEDRQLPEMYSMGFTNIVARPSRNGSELSKQEMDEGVEILHEKCRKYRPETVCVVGKSIWESIWRVRHGKPVGKAFKYGWQDESENMGVIEGEWEGSKVFVSSSTSGLAATLSPAEKERIWAEIGSWAKRRRAERELEAKGNEA
ncbi:uracil-DNA glycosylase-like protein [Fusarium flagelliforme]|uniref:Tdg/mug dna glycosylase n=1 Tax=Fusarium flagelliforme TaxID=2675880 RepID=A0A395MT64_9HYPO|nr:uracil-DNA glycosylase-like protein [Fusarium flagelliforme]KAH7197199.1 uracil-DNA glycosylase-like protein [Fusarium flagelliforme]RFN51144.1 tdg/mug dna glycosylase [Fusarium flagelliforme]